MGETSIHILITGVTGFVGSHMAHYISKNVPDAKIFASKRWRSREENILHLNKINYIEADLLDRGSLNKLIKQSKPDYVFHFAAQSFPGASFICPTQTLTTNGIGTTNLLEELLFARDEGICDPIIISVSSSEVYGMPKEDEVPIKETNPIRAANPYSISKVTHDLMSQYYHKAYGLKIIITRMFSHEGSRRGDQFAISSFAKQIAINENFNTDNEIKVGNLDSVRTYAHIDDAVRAYWLAATKGKIGEIYNIGGKDIRKVGEVLDLLISKSPKEHKVVVDPERVRPTDITLQIPDYTKFSDATGWKPEKGVEEVVDDLLKYWRSYVKKRSI